MKTPEFETRFARLLSGRRGALIMGIVNATPDSFSDGDGAEAPLDKALRLLDEGADLIDIGGESTRPGAEPVSESGEIARIEPVIKGVLRARPGAVFSVDSCKYGVARRGLELGAAAINDVWGLRTQPETPQLAAEAKAGMIVMHSRGDSGSMRGLCRYSCVVSETASELERLVRVCIDAGIEPGAVAVDPGLGFAKTPEQDLALLQNIERFSRIAPVLIGHSRKSFIGRLLGIERPLDREAPTLAISLFAAASGAAILRVHEVKNTRAALEMYGLLTCGEDLAARAVAK